MSRRTDLVIAWFVTPHGFGHAARAAAIMNAIAALRPDVRFEIYTRTPGWFFYDSLEAPFGYHDVDSDVGLVQADPLNEDLPATLRRLERFLPFSDYRLERLAAHLNGLGCRGVVCDVSPLGIAAARVAGLPSFLVENFTWDWIYAGYAAHEPAFTPFARQMAKLYAKADYHVQTRPACALGAADLVTAPVGRKPHQARPALRAELGIPRGAPLALITMGGLRGRFDFLERLAGVDGMHFVVPGAAESVERRGNLILLPHRSRFYHPDLVAASDVVVGKIGYSTLAEVYHAGLPFAFVSRSRFPETEALAAFAREEMDGFEIGEEEYQSGAWAGRLGEISGLPRRERDGENGAEAAARFVLERLARID